MSTFKGFPKEMIDFFDQLKKNNTREWFQEHKKEYEAHVKQPSEEFVLVMGERLRSISAGIHAIPKVNQSLFRLNRDTRFSNDKRPYKTNLGIWFWEGDRKRMECSGFYFHIDEKNLMLGAGIHIFPKELIGPYRDAVVSKKYGPELRKVINKVSKSGYAVSGKHYKRVPSGYDPSHENVDLLLHNGLAAMYESALPDELFSEGIINNVFAHFKKMSPLHTWLTNTLG